MREHEYCHAPAAAMSHRYDTLPLHNGTSGLERKVQGWGSITRISS